MNVWVTMHYDRCEDSIHDAIKEGFVLPDMVKIDVFTSERAAVEAVIKDILEVSANYENTVSDERARRLMDVCRVVRACGLARYHWHSIDDVPIGWVIEETPLRD